MTREINVEPTAEVIDQMARVAKDMSVTLERFAFNMRERKDLTYAAEVVSYVTNSTNSFRLDLMVTRPLRETMK